MKFILTKQTSNVFASDLVDKVDGVFLQYKISQFFGINGVGWNGFISTVKNDINHYLSLPKPKVPYISIMWGSACGNVVWGKYGFVELWDKRKEGADINTPKKYNKYPLFWESGFLDLVEAFLQFFAASLGADLCSKIVIKITGINQDTFEFRGGGNQDFFATDDPNTAYIAAAAKMLPLGYTNTAVRSACYRLVDMYDFYLPETLKVAALIAGSNGFLKLDDNNMINLINPPIISNDIMAHMKLYSNFGVMPTALSYPTTTTNGGVPSNMVNSGLPVHYQLNNDILDKSIDGSYFEAALLNGKNHKGESIELYEVNVREHNDIIQNYRT